MNSDSSDRTIVVIDDDQNFIESIRALLGALNKDNVHYFQDSIEGRDFIISNAQSIELVIIDLLMPKVDGIDILIKLADINFLGHVVIVSGLDERALFCSSHIAKLKQLNFKGILMKPVHFDVLKHIIYAVDLATNTKEPDSEINLTLEDIQHGIANKEFVLAYQPKLHIKTSKIKSAEVLLRWQHPKYGLLYPDSFINFIESSPYMTQITKDIFIESIEMLKKTFKLGYNIKLALNISPVSLFDMNLANFMIEFQEYLLSPYNYITLEVTENIALREVANKYESITKLFLHGFVLSVDDFGTGYASFKNVKDLPFTEVKIDKEFIQGARDSYTSLQIFKSCIAFAKTSNFNCVAEGIETREDWELVKNSDCNEAQGFYIAKPMFEQDFLNFIAENEAKIRIDE